MAAQRKRGSSWSDEETRCLLTIWQEHNIEAQLEDPKKHKGSIYQVLSNELSGRGYDKSSVQCKIRMHTLKRSYRDCKKKLSTSGKGRKLCNFYTELNAILGQRPATSPVKVVESMSRKRRLFNTESSDSDSEDEVSANTQDYGENNADIDDAASEFIVEDRNTNDNQNDDGDTNDNQNDDGDTNDNQNEGKIAENEKNNEKKQCENTTDRKKGKTSSVKKARKTRLEMALGTVMAGFSESNSKLENTLLQLESKKVDVEMKKIELDRERLHSEEKQKREEREHQFRMMQMILGRMNAPQVPSATTPSTSFGSQWETPSAQPYNVQQRGPTPMDDPGHSYYNL